MPGPRGAEIPGPPRAAPAGGRARPAHWPRRASLPAGPALEPALPRRRSGSGGAGGGECRGGTAQPCRGVAVGPGSEPVRGGAGARTWRSLRRSPRRRTRVPGPGRPRGCGRSRSALLALLQHHPAAGRPRGCVAPESVRARRGAPVWAWEAAARSAGCPG